MRFIAVIVLILFSPQAYSQTMGSVRKDVYGFQGGGKGDIYHPYTHHLGTQKTSLRKTFGRSKGRGRLQFAENISNKIYGPKYLRFRPNVYSTNGYLRGVPSSWKPRKEKFKKTDLQTEHTYDDVYKAQVNFNSEGFERF